MVPAAGHHDWVELDGVGAEVLTREECLRLLATTGFGRVAISVNALPAILPVRFVLDGDEIIFRVTPGTVLDSGTRGTIVAFEADRMDLGTGAWSVLATGAARHVAEPAEVTRASRLPLQTWSSTPPDRVVAVFPQLLSGRRLRGRCCSPAMTSAPATQRACRRDEPPG
jgi:uncharacterized protein